LAFIVKGWHGYVFGANHNRAIASSFQESVNRSGMGIIRCNINQSCKNNAGHYQQA